MLDDFKAKQAAKLAGEVAAGGGVGGTLGDEIKALQASILLKQSPLVAGSAGVHCEAHRVCRM